MKSFLNPHPKDNFVFYREKNTKALHTFFEVAFEGKGNSIIAQISINVLVLTSLSCKQIVEVYGKYRRILYKK